MGRAIVILSLTVLASFTFVLVQLWLRRPEGHVPRSRSAPVLDNREDGSVYSLGLQITRLERRVIEEEKRSTKLLADVATLEAERRTLRDRTTALETELRQVREELRRAKQDERPPAGNTPPGNTPGPVGPPEPPQNGP